MTDTDNTPTRGPFVYYQSYLLRLWKETPDSSCRISLQDVGTNEQIGLADLDHLRAFLEAQIDEASSLPEASGLPQADVLPKGKSDG
jgi:hypothetical protein